MFKNVKTQLFNSRGVVKWAYFQKKVECSFNTMPIRTGAQPPRGPTLAYPSHCNRMHPLSCYLHVWRHLPGVPPWILCTIQLGYTLQFCRNPPCFDGVHLTAVNSSLEASVLLQEVSSLLLKGAIEEVSSSDVNRSFFSHYFLVPKKDGAYFF